MQKVMKSATFESHQSDPTTHDSDLIVLLFLFEEKFWQIT